MVHLEDCPPQSFPEPDGGATIVDRILSQLWRLRRKPCQWPHLQPSWSSPRSPPFLSHILPWLASHLPSSLPASSGPPLSWSLPHRILLWLLQPLDHRLCLRDSWVGKQRGCHLLVQLSGNQVKSVDGKNLGNTESYFFFSRPLLVSWQLMSLACYWVGFTTAWPLV